MIIKGDWSPSYRYFIIIVIRNNLAFGHPGHDLLSRADALRIPTRRSSSKDASTGPRFFLYQTIASRSNWKNFGINPIEGKRWLPCVVGRQAIITVNNAIAGIVVVVIAAFILQRERRWVEWAQVIGTREERRCWLWALDLYSACCKGRKHSCLCCFPIEIWTWTRKPLINCPFSCFF